jgi:hypothetical protein
MTALERRQALLENLASMDDDARLEMLRIVVDNMWRFGLSLADVGECMARVADNVRKGGAE